MKFLVLALSLSLFVISCQKEDQAGSTGSGAGIEKQEDYHHDDANITTPINNEDHERKD